MKLTINTDNALFNAGINGFMYVLDRCDIPYSDSGTALTLESEDLAQADLAQVFIDLCIDKFYKTTGVYNAKKQAEQILAQPDEDKDFFKRVKEIGKRFTQNSIKTGITTLTETGTLTDILSIAEKLCYTEEAKVAKELLKELLREFEKPEIQEMVYIKSIMYTKIRQIWDGISFLNRADAKKHPKESFDKVFVKPLKEMLGNLGKKAKKSCALCGLEYNNLTSFSYLNDIGIDVARKKSAFWNFKHDLAICPLCNFVYACTVLGFSQIGQDMVFINSGADIKIMKQANSRNRSEEGENDNYRYKIISQLILEESEQKAKEYDISYGFEVLVRHSAGGDEIIYLVDIIDESTLKKVRLSKNEINLLKKSYAKYRGETVQYAVLGKLLDRQDMYEVINGLLTESNGEYSYVFEASTILSIQIKTEEEKRMKQLRYLSNAACKEGAKIHQFYYDSESKENKNKLKSIYIKLQNALRNEDKDLFFNILFRLYIGIEPSHIFLEALTDNFTPIATGFILGLMGARVEEKETENKKESKQ